MELAEERRAPDLTFMTSGFAFLRQRYRYISFPMRNIGFLLGVLLLAGLHQHGFAQRQTLSGQELSGPSDMGTFTLTPRPDGQSGYGLHYADVDLDFQLSLEGYVLTVSRPDGAFRADYAWLPSGLLMLVNGLDPSADLPVSSPGSTTVASNYRSFAPEQTWLLELQTLLTQQAGVPEVPWEQAPQRAAAQYADLLVASLFRGPKPLAAVELMRSDWPEPFSLIGLPAFDERPAKWLNMIRASEARKQEGSFLSGNYALVSPELGISLAASSGWIALASAAYSPDEGFVAKGNMPYGMVLGSGWDSAMTFLPGYWGLLQTQDGGTAGRNYIHTTALLPGLALILTQTPDSTALIGLTLVYQPFMQGLKPPQFLPPVAKSTEVPRTLAALFWNAGLDWALWEEPMDALLPLTPPGYSLVIPSEMPADALRNGRFFQTGLCPGSDSPVQALCASLLVRQTLERLPEGYKVRVQFLDAAGNPVADLRSPELLTARWVLHHESDQDRPRASYRHAHLEFVYARGPVNASGSTGGAGDFSAATGLEVAVYPAQERF